MNEIERKNRLIFENRINELNQTHEVFPVEQYDEHHTSIERKGNGLYFKQIARGNIQYLFVPFRINEKNDMLEADLSIAVYEKMYLSQGRGERKTLPFDKVLASAYPKYTCFVQSCITTMDETLSMNIEEKQKTYAKRLG